MAIRLITEPAFEPVTLEEAKLHLRVDHTEDDLLISEYIKASRMFVEKFTARALVAQTWELVIDSFPSSEIQLPLPPLQSVESIKYDDSAGVEQTLGTTQYEVDTVSEPGWVVPVITGWPSGTFNGINAVRIRFVAGYASANSPPIDTVPSSLKSAILLQVGNFYANRESQVVGTIVNQLPTGGILHLMRQYRVALGMA